MDWTWWERWRPRFDRVARMQWRRWNTLRLRHFLFSPERFEAAVATDPLIQRCRRIQRRILHKFYLGT